MASYLSNQDLVDKCKRFILADPTTEAMDELIKDALISAEREIRVIDTLGGPLAWNRETYDEMFTRPYATISAITQASPCIITAASTDSDITGHGFDEDDIVSISGIGGMEKLNNRVLRVSLTEKVTGGDMSDVGVDWTSGADWVANVATASDADFEQDVSAEDGITYEVIFTLESVSAGSLTPQIGGVDGDAVTVAGKHTQTILATGTGNLKFQGDGFTGKVTFASATDANKFSLKQINDQIEIDTSSYGEYDSGGHVYMVGFKIPNSTFEPSTGDACYKWKMGTIYEAYRDLYKMSPITQESGLNSSSRWAGYLGYGGYSEIAPTRYRHEQYFYTDPSTVTNFLMFNGQIGKEYSISISYEKSYPDLGTGDSWDDSHYPPHIPEIHDYIWHRALSNLASNTEKARRKTKDGGDNTIMEVQQAELWIHKALAEEGKIISLSRKMIGSGNRAIVA